MTSRGLLNMAWQARAKALAFKLKSARRERLCFEYVSGARMGWLIANDKTLDTDAKTPFDGLLFDMQFRGEKALTDDAEPLQEG